MSRTSTSSKRRCAESAGPLRSSPKRHGGSARRYAAPAEPGATRHCMPLTWSRFRVSLLRPRRRHAGSARAARRSRHISPRPRRRVARAMPSAGPTLAPTRPARACQVRGRPCALQRLRAVGSPPPAPPLPRAHRASPARETPPPARSTRCCAQRMWCRGSSTANLTARARRRRATTRLCRRRLRRVRPRRRPWGWARLARPLSPSRWPRRLMELPAHRPRRTRDLPCESVRVMAPTAPSPSFLETGWLAPTRPMRCQRARAQCQSPSTTPLLAPPPPSHTPPAPSTSAPRPSDEAGGAPPPHTA